MKSIGWWISAWTLLVVSSSSHAKALVNNSSSAIDADDIGIDIGSECSHYVVEREYVLLENGSLMLPDTHALYRTYFVRNGTAYLCADQEESEPEESEQDNESDSPYDFSPEFLSCGHVLIEPHEYEPLPNGSIYVDIYSRVYGPRDYLVQEERGAYVCVPPYEKMTQSGHANAHDAIQNKFPESFSYVTYVGLMLSIVSLLSHLAVFCMVSSVRNLPGCCLASLSLSLLLAYLCFVAIAMALDSQYCADLGICVYYFFLTAFFWMNAIAFDVWRSFRVVMRELRISSHRIPWRRFLLYSVYSWLVPGVLAALVKLADTTDLLPVDYRPSFGSHICWFGSRKALLVFFAVPLCVVMLLNAVFFLDVTYVISRATLKTTQTHEATLRKRFFTFMRLALIMGLTWIVGLVAGYADVPALWYVFVVLNTLQGLFIFVVFSCSSKVRNLCLKRYYGKHSKASGANTSVRTISQVSAGL